MKKFQISLIIVVVLYIVSFVTSDTVKNVRAGNRAVVETMGAVEQKSYENGPVVVFPFISKVVVFNVREQKFEYKMTMKTASMQDVTISGALNYNLNGDQVYRLYEAVGEDYRPVIITPLLEGAMNEVIGKQSAEFLVNSQELVREAIVYIVKDQLDQTQLVNVNDFRMFRPQFDKKFEEAIKDKVVSQQMVEKAKFETQKVEEEAIQMRKKLEAEAYGINLKSKAMNNPLIVKYEFAKAMGKWEGKLPQTLVVGQNGSVPVLPLGK
jgi:regulator of protease activity HflC (stomatin/prohibitin superfamily)